MILQKRFALVVATDRGPCSYVRWRNWAHYLDSTAGGECEIVVVNTPIYDEAFLYGAATVIVTRPTEESHFEIVRRYATLKKKCRFNLAVDYDDLLWTLQGRNPFPAYNRCKTDAEYVHGRLSGLAERVDTVFVSTEFLGICYAVEFGHPEKVKVLPDYGFMSMAWEHKSRRRKPLVLYAGTVTHYSEDDHGDFSGPWLGALGSLMEAGKVEFRIFGDSVPDFFPGGTGLVSTVHASLWPSELSKIAPDLLIAPLQNHPFNKAKAPIKAVEAALIGCPIVASAFNGSPYSGFVDDGCSVIETDGEESLSRKIMSALGEGRKGAVAFTRKAVMERMLVAELKPATDRFLGMLFGKYLGVS